MKMIDAYILARTKRKTRRIRMALVTLVCALMFAVLLFGSFVATGMLASAGQFKDVGYNGRYLSLVYKNGPPSIDYTTVNKDLMVKMDAELRAKGVKVDDTLRNGNEYIAELAARTSKFFMAQAAADQAALEKEIVTKHNPKSLYHMEFVDVLQNMMLRTAADPDPYLTGLRKTTENSGGEAEKGGFSPYGSGMPSFFSLESEMLTPLVQSGASLQWKPGEPYPALVPYAYVAKIADRSFANLSSQEKIDGYAQLIRDYTGKELAYCYRNATAQEQLSGVLSYNKIAETDKDAATKPIAIESCHGFDQALLKKIGVIQTPASDAPKPLFPKKSQPAPETKEIKIRIAGFVPARDAFPTGNVLSSIFSEVNSWPAELPVFVPKEIVAQDTFLQAEAENMNGFGGAPQLFADFATREEQKRFLASGCSGEDCTAEDTLFLLPFGSIKVALESTFNGLAVAVKWAVLAVAVIAVLMLTMTISKIITDSRREIAVFRALGARRRDIGQIYFTYGLMLAAGAWVVAVVLAVAGALLFSAHFSGSVNALMVESVGAYTLPTSTILFGINWPWVAGITGVLLVASIIGILIPVLLSNRKNLMNIMREE